MMTITPEHTTVLLLAAGHGKRMLPLTQDTPKPLLKVGEHSLIEHHLLRLRHAGFKNIVINVAYLAQSIIDQLGDGSRYGLNIQFSDESSTGALETAGGIKHALTLIASDPFISINADVWTDFDFKQLLSDIPNYGKLMMVENPSHNNKGDFAIGEKNLLINSLEGCRKNSHKARTLTYSGIAIYRKKMFDSVQPSKSALAPLFRELINEEKLQGEKLNTSWFDIGTPERLYELREMVRRQETQKLG